MSDLTTQTFLNQHLGRYDIQQRLGAGGMARVFKAHDTNLDRTVAIKVLHDHLSLESTFKDRFEQEARLVAQLNHPNIVQVYDSAVIRREDEHIYYMVMSYIPGPTLRTIMEDSARKDQPLPRDMIQRVMLNVADALGYAHMRGMIHRDVKPANVLMNERNEAILTDFGIARMVQGTRLTQEGNTVGTPTYMSPEQATGDVLDARSDLYSLGVILYEMLCGHPPFADDGSVSVLLRHLNAPVPALPDDVANPSLNAFMQRALAKNPADRFQNAEEFTDNLKRAFAGEHIEVGENITRQLETGPFSIPAPTPQWEAQVEDKRKHRITGMTHSPMLLLAVGLTVIVVLLAISLLSDDTSSAGSDTPTIIEDGLADSMTGSAYFASNFDTDEPFLSLWPQDDFNMVTRTIDGSGTYRIESQLADRAVATVFDEAGGSQYEDLSIQMIAQLDEGSATNSGYGIIFRYVDQDNYNVFAVDGLGRYSIWRRIDGVWRELREVAETWTPHPAVRPLGEMNIIAVEAMGSEFIAYVNGEQVTTITDSGAAIMGAVGIYLASPPGGMTNLTVDMYQTMGTRLSLAESMTGDDNETATVTP